MRSASSLSGSACHAWPKSLAKGHWCLSIIRGACYARIHMKIDPRKGSVLLQSKTEKLLFLTRRFCSVSNVDREGGGGGTKKNKKNKRINSLQCPHKPALFLLYHTKIRTGFTIIPALWCLFSVYFYKVLRIICLLLADPCNRALPLVSGRTKKAMATFCRGVSHLGALQAHTLFANKQAASSPHPWKNQAKLNVVPPNQTPEELYMRWRLPFTPRYPVKPTHVSMGTGTNWLSFSWKSSSGQVVSLSRR